MKVRSIVILAASVILLAGCSSGTTSSAKAPRPTFTYGASAAAIATAVKACKNVTEEAVPASAVGVASLASCTIDGKQVDFYSWDDAKAQGDPTQMFAGMQLEAYYVASEGWSVFSHLDGDMAGQKSVANAVTKSIGGKVFHSKP